MSENEFLLTGLPDLKKAASWLLSKSVDHDFLAFYGELGAGKTTLIQEICRQEGVIHDVTSPTFAIVNEYLTRSGKIIYHFDFYRLDSAEEVLDIGFEDYISSGNKCFMEWPEKIEPYLPAETLRVYIDVNPGNSRVIHIDFPS